MYKSQIHYQKLVPTMLFRDYYNFIYSSLWSMKYNYSSKEDFSWLSIMLGSDITDVCYLHCLLRHQDHLCHCFNKTWKDLTFCPEIIFMFPWSDPVHANNLAANWWVFIWICLQLVWSGSLDNNTSIVMTHMDRKDWAAERKTVQSYNMITKWLP